MDDSWSEMVVMGMTLTQKTKKRGAMMKTRVEAMMDGGTSHNLETWAWELHQSRTLSLVEGRTKCSSKHSGKP